MRYIFHFTEVEKKKSSIFEIYCEIQIENEVLECINKYASGILSEWLIDYGYLLDIGIREPVGIKTLIGGKTFIVSSLEEAGYITGTIKINLEKLRNRISNLLFLRNNIGETFSVDIQFK